VEEGDPQLLLLELIWLQQEAEVEELIMQMVERVEDSREPMAVVEIQSISNQEEVAGNTWEEQVDEDITILIIRMRMEEITEFNILVVMADFIMEQVEVEDGMVAAAEHIITAAAAEDLPMWLI
jgi:hypothetical protein